MGVFDRQAAVALRLIEKFGEQVTYRSLASTFDATPWQGDTPVPTDYTIFAAFIPVDRVDRDTMVYREYTDIPIGFTTAYIARQAFIPKLKDTIIREGKQYSVARVQAYKPNSEVIAYVLEVTE